MPRFRKLITTLGIAGVTTFLAAPAAVAHPQLDGTIAIQSFRDGQGEIYVVTSSSQTNITNDPADDDDPAWSPDGTRIAFKSTRGGNADIWVMNADGSSPSNLTQSPGDDFYPTWSPDGSRIAFHSMRDGNGEIYVMNADGTGQTNITNDPALDVTPRWSPDGARIALMSNRTGNFEVFLMNPDGSAINQLTTDAAFDLFPDWSPDSSKIAFASNRNGGIFEVFVMNADGTSQTALTTDGKNSTAPAFAPDGVHMAYQSDRGGNPDAWLVHLDGTDNTQLTLTPLYDGDPDWKPSPETPPPPPKKPTCERKGLSGGPTIANRLLGVENENGPISRGLHASEPRTGALRPVVHEASCVVAAVDGTDSAQQARAVTRR